MFSSLDGFPYLNLAITYVAILCSRQVNLLTLIIILWKCTHVVTVAMSRSCEMDQYLLSIMHAIITSVFVHILL